MKLASRMSILGTETAFETLAKARALEAEGRTIIHLEIGEPDFDTPAHIIEAGKKAMDDGLTRYTPINAIPELREAISAKFKRDNGLDYSLDEIAVGCGGKQIIFNAFMATLNAGDEVIIPSPYWVSYPDIALLFEGKPVFVECKAENGFRMPPDDLVAAITPKTKWLIMNSPSNPSGAAYTREDLKALTDVLMGHDQVWILTDDIYEHIIYDGCRHVPMAAIDGMADRTVTLNSLSKTYSVTGWRVGWAISPPGLTGAIRKVHDFLTVGAAAPLQEAGAVALSFPETYYAELAAGYQRRRDMLLALLEPRGFVCFTPRGAYYVMTDIGGFGFADDVEFSRYLVQEVGVAVVPGSSFYHDPALGRTKVRFTFCKRDETLQEAGRRLQVVAARAAAG